MTFLEWCRYKNYNPLKLTDEQRKEWKAYQAIKQEAESTRGK